MVLLDLLLTCQNQWLKGSKFNPKFSVLLIFDVNTEPFVQDSYILKGDFYSNADFLNKYSLRKVIYWVIYNLNELAIKIEGTI